MSEWVPVLTRAQKEREKGKAKKKNMKKDNMNKANRSNTMAERREQEDNKIIKAIEDNKNEQRAKWTNINDTENKLVVLGELNKRVQNREQKAKVKKLTDAYEKQKKQLIIAKAAKNNKTNGATIEINSDDNNKTIMSNITSRTANSAWRERENKINESEINKNDEMKENNSVATLESLGKTRRSRSMGTDKGKSENNNRYSELQAESDNGTDEADLSVMSKITKQTTNKGNSGQETIDLVDENSNDDGTLMSRITLEEDNKDKMTTTNKSTLQNLKTPITENTSLKVVNPYSTPTQKADGKIMNESNKVTYLEVVNDEKEKNERKTIQENFMNDKYIQIRFQFKGKYSKQSTQQKIRDVLYHTMRCAKIIDESAALMPWSDEDAMPTLNGNEIKLHSEKEIMSYIDTPINPQGKIVSGRNYYNNGIRIKTRKGVYEFTEEWNNKRYDKTEGSPFQEEWQSIKRAAMQRSPVA